MTENYTNHSFVETFKDEFEVSKDHDQENVWIDGLHIVALLAPDVEDLGGQDLDVLDTPIEEVRYKHNTESGYHICKLSSDNSTTIINVEYLEKALSVLDVNHTPAELLARVVHSEEREFYPIQIRDESGWSVLIAPRVHDR